MWIANVCFSLSLKFLLPEFQRHYTPLILVKMNFREHYTPLIPAVDSFLEPKLSKWISRYYLKILVRVNDIEWLGNLVSLRQYNTKHYTLSFSVAHIILSFLIRRNLNQPSSILKVFSIAQNAVTITFIRSKNTLP